MSDSKEVSALIARVIPRKDQRRVFNLMRTRPWFRIIDVQRATGHNSDEQRLRELRTNLPALFRVRKVTYKDRGGSHLEHQLRSDWMKIMLDYERGTL